MSSPRGASSDATTGGGLTQSQGPQVGQQQQQPTPQQQQLSGQQIPLAQAPQSGQQHQAHSQQHHQPLTTNPAQMLPQTQASPNFEPPKPPTPKQTQPQKQQQPAQQPPQHHHNQQPQQQSQQQPQQQQLQPPHHTQQQQPQQQQQQQQQHHHHHHNLPQQKQQPQTQTQPQQHQQSKEQALIHDLPSIPSTQSLPLPQTPMHQAAKADSEKSTTPTDPKQKRPAESKSKSPAEPKQKASPVEPKAKTTRARKQTAAQINNKAASVTSATTTPPRPKTESKRERSKKAKQNGKPAQQGPKSEPMSSQALPATQQIPPNPSNFDNKTTAIPQQTPPEPSSSKKKRKPRAAASNSTPSVTAATTATGASSASSKANSAIASPSKSSETEPPAASPPKRSRKKKGTEPGPGAANSNDNHPPLPTMAGGANMTSIPSLNGGTHPQLLSVATNVPMGASPLMPNAPLLSMQQQQQQQQQQHQQSNINRQVPGMSPMNVHDPTNRYYSLTISPYANYDYNNVASSLTRPSLSRLFTSSASAENGHTGTSSHSDEIARAFEDLREGTWNHLSKCILDHAQQFDIPSLIGTLYTLRSENEKLTNKVRDLTNRRDHLVAINARLDLPGPMLTQHLNHTSPNFSSVVASLTNSPKSLPNSSPTPAMNNKSPIVPGGSHNPLHGPPINSLGPPGFIDRNSPLVGLPTPYSGVNSLRSSTISTPSPPTGALMAHGANRASLTTMNNPPYMSNVHPSLSALNQLGGPNPPSSPYYPRK